MMLAIHVAIHTYMSYGASIQSSLRYVYVATIGMDL